MPQPTKMHQYLALILITFSDLSCGHIKTWSHNGNYANSENWDTNQIPCPQDRAIYPPVYVTVSLLPSGINLQEMVLPRNGELLLTPGPLFAPIGETNTVDCNRPKNDVRFSIWGSYSWYDAMKWKTESDFVLNDFTVQNPVPHAHRIPCQNDHAIFPNASSYRVFIPDYMNIPLSSLTINGKSFYGEEFNIWKRESKQLFFDGRGSVSVNAQTCNDKSGCFCNNEQQNIMDMICLVTPGCGKLRCTDPIHVDAHCCPICGSLVTVEHKPEFEMEGLRKELEYFLAKDYLNSISCYLWKSLAGLVQLLCLDQVADNEKMTHKFLDYITKILNNDPNLHIKGFTIETSSSWKTTPSEFGLAGVFGIILAVFLIIFLLIGGIAIYRKRRYPTLSFVRFDSDVNKVEMELDANPDLEPEPTASTGAQQSFLNPLFGFKFRQDKPKAQKDVHENPLYGIKEDND